MRVGRLANHLYTYYALAFTFFSPPYLRTSGRYTDVRLAAGNGEWNVRFGSQFSVVGSSCSSRSAHLGAPSALMKRN